MAARSSPADLAVEMLGGTDEELAVSAVTFRRVAIISYKRFYEQITANETYIRPHDSQQLSKYISLTIMSNREGTTSNTQKCEEFMTAKLDTKLVSITSRRMK